METLLHEMIHAYLFITDGNDDHDGHGKAFHSHMYRINKEAGTKISVYHNFHDEVCMIDCTLDIVDSHEKGTPSK